MRITFILLLFFFSNTISKANSTEDNKPTESIDFSPKIKSVEIVSMNISKDYKDFYDVELKINTEKADSVILFIEENNNPTLRKEIIFSPDSIQFITLKNINSKEPTRIEIIAENDFNTDSYILDIPVSSTPQGADIKNVLSNSNNEVILAYNVSGMLIGHFKNIDELNSINYKVVILKTYHYGVLKSTKVVSN